MKYLVLIGDGMADYPLHELGGRTPVEAARTPAMDRIADLGICGLFHPIPNGFPAGSDIGNLSLFGYDP
ncbi:MAG: phosphoglycerate mutase, partial [Candidatus Hydrogenedentes bacterium]|nr:phosphoglycerate mutase [Candidatus Hydrogenedentota bacterium]